MHSPLWQVAWSTLQGPAGTGGFLAEVVVVVVVGGVVKTGGGPRLDSTMMIGQIVHAGGCRGERTPSHAATSVLAER